MTDEEISPLLPPPSAPLSSARPSSWRARLFSLDNALLLANAAVCTAYALVGKKVSEMMQNYTFTLAFMQPVSLWPLFCAAFAWGRCRGTLRPLSCGTFSWLLVCTVCVFVNTLGTKYGSRGDLVSGPVGSLASQVQIVFLMALSILFLRTRYRLWHYVGAFVVTLAVIVVLIPALINGLSVNSAAALVVLILSYIPLTVSVVITQHLLQAGSCDITTAYFVISSVHSVVNLLAIPLIPILQPGVQWWDGIRVNLRDGFLCLLAGRNSAPGDDCPFVGLWFVGYLLTLLGAAVLALVIQKRMSATASSLSSSAAIPISSFLFILPLFGGFPFSWYLVGSLILMIIGLVIYRITPEEHRGPTITPPPALSVNDDDDASATDAAELKA